MRVLDQEKIRKISRTHKKDLLKEITIIITKIGIKVMITTIKKEGNKIITMNIILIIEGVIISVIIKTTGIIKVMIDKDTIKTIRVLN